MFDKESKTLQYTTEGNVATIQLTQEYSTMSMIKELTQSLSWSEIEMQLLLLQIK
mgnify:CR=1 FL=1